MMGCGCRASVRERRRVVGGGFVGHLGAWPHVARGLELEPKLDIVAVLVEDKPVEADDAGDGR